MLSPKLLSLNVSSGQCMYILLAAMNSCVAIVQLF